MVLRDWYIQHESKKRQEEADARELAPYRDYLDEAFEHALDQERAILKGSRSKRPRRRISLAEALIKLPLKSIQDVENRFWEAQRGKDLDDQFRREFLNWLRTTKPHLGPHDPQERVQRFSETFKGPVREAYEEGYGAAREEMRRSESANRAKSTDRNDERES